MAENKEVQIAQLGPGDLMGFEYVSTRWDAKIGHGISLHDLENPAFWAHQAVQLKPFDEIRARAEDGTWVAYFVVTDCSRTWARVRLDRLVNLSTGDVSQSQALSAEAGAFAEQHKVLWRGAAARWSVVRKLDGAVLYEGAATRIDADSWLERMARQQEAPKAEA